MLNRIALIMRLTMWPKQRSYITFVLVIRASIRLMSAISAISLLVALSI
jgi:hypothetical protein